MLAESRELEGRKLRICQGWDAIWNRGELDATEELLAAAYVRETANVGRQDLRDFKRMVRSVRSGFPDLRLEVDEMVGEREKVATRWSVSGTQTGTFLGMPAIGRKISLRGVTISTFQGDLVIADWVTWEPPDMMRALGILFIGQGEQ
jgi:steroid delta-isomerase-like uncharacterized protein